MAAILWLAASGAAQPVRVCPDEKLPGRLFRGDYYRWLRGREATYTEPLSELREVEWWNGRACPAKLTAGRINDIFVQVLGRNADPGGIGWGQGVLAGGGNLSDIRYVFGSGGEAANEIMADCQTEFGRNANSNEMSYFQTALEQGWATSFSLRAGLATSLEGQGYIAAIYQNVLGRADNGGDLAWAVGALEAGGTLGDIWTALSTTGEAAANVQALFVGIWGRQGGP